MGRTSTPDVALRYSRAFMKPTTLGQHDVLDKLEGKDIRYIRLQWLDYTNIIRYRVIPAATFFKLLSTPRPGIAISKAVLGIIGSSLAPGFSGTGEYLYTPDLKSTRLCGYAPGHASLMGWFEEMLPILENAENALTRKVPLCPRWLLQGIVKCVSMNYHADIYNK
jgi:hypothetical protein